MKSNIFFAKKYIFFNWGKNPPTPQKNKHKKTCPLELNKKLLLSKIVLNGTEFNQDIKENACCCWNLCLVSGIEEKLPYSSVILNVYETKHIAIISSLLNLHPPFFTLKPTPSILHFQSHSLHSSLLILHPHSSHFNFEPHSKGWSLTSKKPFLFVFTFPNGITLESVWGFTVEVENKMLTIISFMKKKYFK